MAQFIHLSLLLAATIQLPLVSVTQVRLREGSNVTLKFPPGLKVSHCCRDGECECVSGKCKSNGTSLPGVTVTDRNLTIKNMNKKDSGNYTCCGASHSDQCLYRKVTIATIQLPLVSETQVWLQKGSSVTLKFPPGWKVSHCCRDGKCECISGKCMPKGSSLPRVTVTDRNLTIKNMNKKDSGIYDCYGASHSDQCLYLKVEIGDRTQEQKHTTEADCRTLCIEDPICQYFTFRGNKCSLKSSKDEVEIQLDTNTVSECPRGYSNMNYQTTSEYPGESTDAGPHFYQEAKSWIDALEHCHNENSSLVQITNSTVQHAVNDLLQNKIDSMQNGVWIGLERSIFGRSVPWMWTSGEEVQYDQWDSSFPVDRLNNHCGKIIWVNVSEEFKWLDACCHEVLPFICQGLNEEPTGHQGDPT